MFIVEDINHQLEFLNQIGYPVHDGYDPDHRLAKIIYNDDDDADRLEFTTEHI